MTVSCTQAPESDQAETGDEVEVDDSQTASAADLPVDLSASSITWVGTKPTGRHNGTFAMSEGSIKVENGEVVGGTCTIDINSLKVVDLEDEESNAKLAGHLRSEDFFKVEEFPTATFEIASLEAYDASADSSATEEDSEFKIANPTHMVTGNLTLLGVTKSIKFPAKVSVSEGEVSAEAKFNIDRKEWGMSYGADESLGDKMINPTVHLGFNIVAKNAGA